MGAVLGHGSDPAFAHDTGAANPLVTQALAAFAAARGSERAALVALAQGRLLVPVVAAPPPADNPAENPAGHRAGQVPAAVASPRETVPGGRRQTEMATLVLIGQDGRPALPVFSCVAALQRWRPAARPVPVAAASIWRSAASAGQAVIIDVAGPVPFPVEGARLAALAAGTDVPPPEEDPDVRAAVAAALAGQPAVTGFELAPGADGADLTVLVRLEPGREAAVAAALSRQAGPALRALLGARLRRGITVTAARQ